MNTEKKGQNTKTLLMILGIAAGFALLLFGNGAFSSADNESVETVASSYDERVYEAELVAKIEKICSQVRGAGKVSVAVTLDGSFKTVLAQNSQSNLSGGAGTQKHEYVLVGSGSSESAVPIGYSPPDILGVGIVCSGGANAWVRAEIISLVSATFDLPTNKIYVTAAQN